MHVSRCMVEEEVYDSWHMLRVGKGEFTRISLYWSLFFVPSDETAADKAVELFYWVDSETAHKGSDYDEWCWRIKVNTFWWTLQSKQSLNGKRFKSLKIFS